MRELAAQPLPRTIHAPPYAIFLALHALRLASGRVLPLATRLHLIDEVSRTSASNVVHGCLLGAQTLLLLEFLVEAEHGALALLHVAGAAAASRVEGAGGGCGELDARGGPAGGGACGEGAGGNAQSVAGAAAAGVDVGGFDRGVGLGDVEGWHFDGGWLGVVVVVVVVVMVICC